MFLNEQLEFFKENIKTKLIMECCSCNNTYVEHFDIKEIEDYEKTKQEFAKKAYEKGWRYSVSTIFAGRRNKAIRCKSCHTNRNNKNYFD
jgi:hypothetical protein